MSLHFEELDFQPTPIGDLVLRRRRMSKLGDTDIFEIKLGDEYLMSSLFHEAETQLGKLGMQATQGDQLSVIVGGLGLGYTAAAALEDPRINSLVVIDYLAPVIQWHRAGLLPIGKHLAEHPRCKLVHADFFAFCREIPSIQHDAILLDIDHTPTNVLHQTNSRFYTEQGLDELSKHLKPGGVFALWADGGADENFKQHLLKVFKHAECYTISFENPITGTPSRGAVYVAKTMLS